MIELFKIVRKGNTVFFSFLTRLFSSKPSTPPDEKSEENTTLKIFVIQEGGKFFHNFSLFHQNTVLPIDTLVFLPHFGIFFGETLNWTSSELENSSIERSSREIKRPPTTRFETTEAHIRQKLNDVLSFDFTPIYRFVWMKNLTEAEFDALDSSFHDLLPKTHIFFKDETLISVKEKLFALGEYRDEPLSNLKIVGALNSHTFILPSLNNPSGAILSPEQNSFLSLAVESPITLYGDYGSGKSTLILRKAMVMLLNNPHERILFFSPTLLASELMRNEFVSLMYYGALGIDLTRITFAPPQSDFMEMKSFEEATALICDDTYLMPEGFIEQLNHHRAHRSFILTNISEVSMSTHSVHLIHRYRNHIRPKHIQSSADNTIHLLLLQIRQKLMSAEKHAIMIVVSDSSYLAVCKEAVDEYLGSNCRVITPEFSLQYQDLDDILVTTSDEIGGLCAPHLFVIAKDTFVDYTFILSRASETSTIITYPDSNGESHAEDTQE